MLLYQVRGVVEAVESMQPPTTRTTAVEALESGSQTACSLWYLSATIIMYSVMP